MSECGGDRHVRRSDALERVNDGILSLDREFRVVYLNTQAEGMVDQPRDELLGTVFWQVFPDAEKTISEDELRVAMETQQRHSFERYNKGLDRWLDVRVYPDRDGLTLYITETKGKEEYKEELKKVSRQLRALIKNTSEAIYIKDTDGHYRLMNEAAAELFSLSPSEVIGKHDEQLFDASSAAEIREVDDRIIARDEAESQEAVRYIDGEKYIFLDNKYPYHNERGEVVGIMGISRDITDRVERERELRRKTERLDEFASVVSHDLRNPLSVARGQMALLQDECEEESHLERLDAIATSMERMEEIIEDTLTLARQGRTIGDTEEISISELAIQCWGKVVTPEASIDINNEFTVRGDPSRLYHVFENLFRNAVDHAGEDVRVSVGQAGEDCIYVEDNGPGIPEDIRDDVFEVGYTSTAEGTGLGLPIVKRICEAHGWEIAIVDGRTGGARFELRDVVFVDE